MTLAMAACQAAQADPAFEPLAHNLLSSIMTAGTESSQQKKLFIAAVDQMLLPICHQFLPGDDWMWTSWIGMHDFENNTLRR